MSGQKKRNIPLLRIRWDEDPEEKVIKFFSELVKLRKQEIDT